MSQDRLRLTVAHYLLEVELLQQELRQLMPVLKEKASSDHGLTLMLDRLDAILARVERAASGVD